MFRGIMSYDEFDGLNGDVVGVRDFIDGQCIRTTPLCSYDIVTV